jgi:hypothetical protein
MRKIVCIAIFAATAACGSSGSGGGGSTQNTIGGVPVMAGFKPGPAPAAGQGYQIVLPVVTDIPAGGSIEYCSWSNVILDKDEWFKSSQGWQTETGHHVIVFYTMNPQPAGQSRVCTDADMASFRFAISSIGEGVDQDNVLPGDLAVHIPKGAQLVVNHHYLNATAKTVAEAQSAVNVNTIQQTASTIEASSLAFVDTAMSIPPGLASVDVNCTIMQDFATWYFIPHAHNWATHVTVDHISGTTMDRLFDVDWEAGYAFHPPTITHDPTQPYMLHQGDQIHVHCDYNNTTNAPLTFGAEMCVSYAQTVDKAQVGNMACDQGQWGPF